MSQPLTFYKRISIEYFGAIGSPLLTFYLVQGNTALFHPSAPGYDWFTDLLVVAASASCLWWWGSIIDKQPVLILNNEGLWYRKYPIPFSPLQHAPWSEMAYCFLAQENGAAPQLIIKQKHSSSEINRRIPPLSLPISALQVALQDYSHQYGFALRRN